jgi:hypothetical protein
VLVLPLVPSFALMRAVLAAPYLLVRSVTEIATLRAERSGPQIG